MQGSRVFVVLSLYLQFCGIHTCHYCVEQPCRYISENVNEAHQQCCQLSEAACLSTALMSGDFPRLDTEMTNAFLDYCSRAQKINSCVLGLLKSRECGESLSETYMVWANKSNSMCSATGSLGGEITKMLKVSSYLYKKDIVLCTPASFDFKNCKERANKKRNKEKGKTMEDIANQETAYLRELSLCLHSSVIVGCLNSTSILTVLFEIDEWLPPRLGANTTNILRTLNDRDAHYLHLQGKGG